jgi:hypothetical protein
MKELADDSEFKEPPIPLFQKTERLVVFMKELAVRIMGFLGSPFIVFIHI